MKQDALEGASLVEHLDASGLPLSAAFWAHDRSLNIWRLILAAPRRNVPSPRSAYERVQSSISVLGLNLALSRITFVHDTDPLIGTVREFASTATADIVEVPLGGADVGGGPVDVGYGYQVEGLRFEKALLSALQRSQPETAVLRRVERTAADDGFDFDFLLDSGNLTVFVIAKALPRTLSSGDVQRIASGYADAVRRYGRSALLIVSKTGFVDAAVQVPGLTRSIGVLRVSLVKWSDAEDDEELRRALEELLST